jgi:hypothetical protein
MNFRNFLFFLIYLLSASGCVKDEVPSVPTQSDVLKEIYQVINERYSLFQDKKVNWDSVYSVYSNQITDGTTDAQLFRIAVNMLDHLKDGHVALFSPFGSVAYDGYYSRYPKNFNLTNITSNYLNNSYLTTGPLIYKKENGIGYLLVQTFKESFTQNDLEDILNYMNGTKGIIIDARDNQGGDVQLAQMIASKFYNQKRIGKYEQIKTGKEKLSYSDPQPYYINATASPYQGQLIILTNRKCYSACNDFVLFMKNVPKILQIGDQTGGGGAIPNQFILSNGWKLQYSASRTLSGALQPVEQGLLPDVSISISPIQEQLGIDPILDEAIRSIK